MDLNNGDLLSSAMTDEPVEQEVASQEAPQTEQQESGQPRDENGRFATKPAQAAQQTEQQPQHGQQGWVPPGRLREEREAREAIERRFNEERAQWQRQMQEIQSRLPKPEPVRAPDVFEDPNGFLNHGVREAVDPIKSEIGQLREYYSQRDAVREYGAEKVMEARKAMEMGMSARDPEAWGIYNRAMQSMDPYGEIVKWHQQKSVYSQIGSDPAAWFGKELETKLADPKFAAEIMQKIQSSVQSQANPQGQQQGIINVPPNLRRAPGARAGSEESGDMSNASLMAASMR